MKKFKKTSQVLGPIILIGILILGVSCAWFFYRGQQTLFDLLNHTAARPTDVYSRWLELRTDGSVTEQSVLETLQMLNYQSSPARTLMPGQFRQAAAGLELVTRGFRFPDVTFPSESLSLHFSSDRLDKVTAHDILATTMTGRLEPRLLAQWSVKGGAAHPQVRLEELPAYVPQAILSIEDKRFYHHGAFDPVGLLRAMAVDLRRGHLSQGASTISQQLARSIFLSVERTWRRKVLEAGLAFYLEARYSKSQLLEMYLNQVYWGQDGADSLLGLESASRSFFGKSASQLTLAESALLAGTLQSPNRFSPRAVPEIAMERRNRVLALMRAQGLISQDQFNNATQEPLRLASTVGRGNEAPYFVATLQDILAQDYSLNVLLTQGWQIFTTLDPVLQHEALQRMSRKSKTNQNPDTQAALVVLDPHTGGIRAWVGGRDYAQSSFDRVINAHRQPGSAFKPMVVLAALDTRKATVATLLDDTRLQIKTSTGTWTPKNYDRVYRGKVSVWDALVQSINVPIVRLAMATGLPTVAQYAHRLGIESPLREVPSLALGTSEVTTLELCSAYATLANGGIYNPPYSIEDIMDSSGTEIEHHALTPQVVVSSNSVYLVTILLQDVLINGTAKAAKSLGFTFVAAGKTGTSENYQDAWFIGYVPNLVCGIWVGYDLPKSMGHSAAGVALPLWTSFMQSALTREPPEKFEVPKELIWKTVDVDSGMLARSGCPHRREEPFLPGTLPALCTVHPGGLKGFFIRWRRK